MTYQIQIALRKFQPKIWRRILVSPDLLLTDFHKIIQTAMGWTNTHLHQFIKNRKYYAKKLEDDYFWDESDNVDYSKLRISDLLKKEKDKVIYEYDFGDGWEHDIILEKILPEEENVITPICIKGKNNCPPEDCGGVWGYVNMLEILENPDHQEYKELIEWLGGKFDPTYFDIDDINEALKLEDYGCVEFF